MFLFLIRLFISVVQRYSAPEQTSSSTRNNVEIISVKALEETFNTDEFHRNRTPTFIDLSLYANELGQTQFVLNFV